MTWILRVERRSETEKDNSMTQNKNAETRAERIVSQKTEKKLALACVIRIPIGNWSIDRQRQSLVEKPNKTLAVEQALCFTVQNKK